MLQNKKLLDTIGAMSDTKKAKFDLSKITLPKFTFKETPMNGFLVLALVVFAFLLGMLTNKVTYLEQQASNPAPTTATTTETGAAPPVTVDLETIKGLFDKSKHIVFGDANNKNLIVEIADPSCPYCHIAAGKNPELAKEAGAQFTPESEGGNYVAPVPEIKKLVDQGDAGFVWIYYPGHGNGEMGTKAMYCAYDMGKFWEVHDKLMTNAGYSFLNDTLLNDTTKSQELVDFLADTGIDTNALKECVDSGKYDSRLTEDVNVSTTLGVGGTPGFFINETPFTGAYSWKEMEASIN